MGVIRAVASARVSRAGGGKHLPYLVRPEALRPDRTREGTREGRDSPHFEHRLNKVGARGKGASGSLGEKAAAHEEARERKGDGSSLHEADAVWTWNAPSYVTGDSYGAGDGRSEARRKVRLERGLKLAGVADSERPGSGPLTLEEKAEKARAYFGLLSDAEKMRGGINSYRVVLTVSGDVKDQDMRVAVNEFLRETFPEAQALVALHHNTGHIHAHVYVHSRQLDGKKIDLKQDYFRLDEKWARVCAEYFRDSSILDEHMRLKEETRQYRKEERVAREGSKTLPDKPGRWADQFEVLRGMVRPWDDRYVGRLMATARVAESRAEYLKATNSAPSQVTEAERDALELQGRLQSVRAKRALARSEAKRSLPAEVITVEEQRELALYAKNTRAVVAAAEQKAPMEESRLVQVSFDFGTGHARQLTLGFGSEVSTKRRSKAKGRSGARRVPDGGVKEQSRGGRPDEVKSEREILGRAMVTGAEAERLTAELARARAHGDKWRLNIYDATHKRERVISEFELRRRCEELATRAVHGEGQMDSGERRRKHQQKFDGELTKHSHGIAHHREVVGQTIQGLGERLSAAQQEHDFYRPQAAQIQARYAATNTLPPQPILSFAELNRLQDHAVFTKDGENFLAFERIREGMALERGEQTRTDFELARLHGQLLVAGSDARASEHRGEEFEHTRHLTRWDIDGETCSLSDIDRQVNQLQEQARILVNPHALIPQLAHPVRQAARLAVTLGKNLNLSPSKREQATHEIARLLNVREQVENQIAARGESLNCEARSASGIQEALGEVFRKEVSQREHSGSSIPSPALTASELNRLGSNALLAKNVEMLKEFHALEEVHFRSQPGDERARSRELCGRAAGREVVAEINVRESEKKVLDFEARERFVHVVVKDAEGRDLSLSLAELKDPRRLVEYVAKRVFESGERKQIRRQVERAVEAERLRLQSEGEKARQVFESTSLAARDYRERFLEKNTAAPPPIFTPEEINTIELYSVREVDPKVAARYDKLIREAEKEGRVLNEAKGVPALRESPSREEAGRPRARPRSQEEQKIGDAHAWALRELKTGGQREILLRSPEEFAVALSAEVRKGLSEAHGLSIEGLGHTRGSWANTVLLNVRSALNGAASGQAGHTFDQSLQIMQSMKQAIDQGDERLLNRLSGPDRQSKEYEAHESRERDIEQKKKDKDLMKGQDYGLQKPEGAADHDALEGRENPRTERLDRLEHLFTR